MKLYTSNYLIIFTWLIIYQSFFILILIEYKFVDSFSKYDIKENNEVKTNTNYRIKLLNKEEGGEEETVYESNNNNNNNLIDDEYLFNEFKDNIKNKKYPNLIYTSVLTFDSGEALIFNGIYNDNHVVIKLYRRKSHSVKNELKMLTKLNNHPNILPVITHYDHPRSILIYPFMNCLDNYLDNLSEKQIINYSYNIANGLKYIHSKKIVHGDLKCSNIMISDDNQAMINDFGNAGYFNGNDEIWIGVGTERYNPPEVLIAMNRTSAYDKVDV
jgi:serine/threonine protein kinase